MYPQTIARHRVVVKHVAAASRCRKTHDDLFAKKRPVIHLTTPRSLGYAFAVNAKGSNLSLLVVVRVIGRLPGRVVISVWAAGMGMDHA